MVGATNYNGYGTDLVVMGRDQDVVADGETYVLCETTGTCDYPVFNENVFLTIFDTSSGTEFTPFSISNDGSVNATANPQAVLFSTLINEQFVSISIMTDCSGQLGGDTVTDECGTCGGSGIPDGECDCFGNIVDECGTCGGSGIPDGECDCFGSTEDCAGICGGHTVEDCFGICGGSSQLDDCGVCDGGNQDQDCAGVCNGDSYTDECGTCDADSSNDCIQDCSGTWGGTAEIDCAGICGGDSYVAMFYFDADGDGLGFGDGEEICSIEASNGYVSNNNDLEPNCSTNDTDSCDVCVEWRWRRSIW